MAVQSEQVAAAPLVGGGETPLHSHAGGGNGATIKAGIITTDANGDASVSFNTPFADTGYAIALTAIGGLDTVACMFTNKTVNGFSVRTEDDGGKAEANVEVLWLATPYSNP